MKTRTALTAAATGTALLPAGIWTGLWPLTAAGVALLVPAWASLAAPYLRRGPQTPLDDDPFAKTGR